MFGDDLVGEIFPGGAGHLREVDPEVADVACVSGEGRGGEAALDLAVGEEVSDGRFEARGLACFVGSARRRPVGCRCRGALRARRVGEVCRPAGGGLVSGCRVEAGSLSHRLGPGVPT